MRQVALRKDDDEAAIFQVVEAIFVAVLVATALIFFALVQKPTPSAAGPGIDLGRLAGDALAILQGDDPGDNAADGLENDVMDLLDPDTGGNPGELEGEVEGVLPVGLRFLLRTTWLTTSMDDDLLPTCDQQTDAYVCSVYGPTSTVAQPRNAQGAVTYVMHDTTHDPILVELVVWNAF